MFFSASSMTTMMSNLLTMTAGTLCILLGACGGDDGPELDPDGSIVPLDPPDEEDQTPPDTPRNNFASCFGTSESFQLMIEGRNAYYSDEDPADACGIVHVDRESVCLAGEECDPDGELGDATGDILRFRGTARWGDSAPTELYTEGPGDQGYSLMASRAQARADGSPLSELRGMALPPSTSWGDIYPDYASGLGFVWPIEGELNLTNCHVDMTIYGTVMTVDGFGETLDQVVLPLYSDRVECVAEKDFSNEIVTIYEGPISVAFSEAHSPVTVCDPDLPCEDVNEEENPESVTMTLIHDEPAPAEEVDPGDSDSGGEEDDDSDSDGGIPPIDPPPDDEG